MNFVETDVPDGDGRDQTADLTVPVPPAFKEGMAGMDGKVVVGFRPEHLELGEVEGPAAVSRAPPTSSSTSATRSCSTSPRAARTSSRSSTRRTG